MQSFASWSAQASEAGAKLAQAHRDVPPLFEGDDPAFKLDYFEQLEVDPGSAPRSRSLRRWSVPPRPRPR